MNLYPNTLIRRVLIKIKGRLKTLEQQNLDTRITALERTITQIERGRGQGASYEQNLYEGGTEDD